METSWHRVSLIVLLVSDNYIIDYTLCPSFIIVENACFSYTATICRIMFGRVSVGYATGNNC